MPILATVQPESGETKDVERIRSDGEAQELFHFTLNNLLLLGLGVIRADSSAMLGLPNTLC